ncbi:MAG TPA: hypothetical protein VF602_07205 [Pedobacter sp.]
MYEINRQDRILLVACSLHRRALQTRSKRIEPEESWKTNVEVFVGAVALLYVYTPAGIKREGRYTLQSLRFGLIEIRNNFDKNLSEDGELSCNPD